MLVVSVGLLQVSDQIVQEVRAAHRPARHCRIELFAIGIEAIGNCPAQGGAIVTAMIAMTVVCVVVRK